MMTTSLPTVQPLPRKGNLEHNLSAQLDWLNQNRQAALFAGFSYAPTASKDINPDTTSKVFNFDNLTQKRRNGKASTLASLSEFGDFELQSFRQQQHVSRNAAPVTTSSSSAPTSSSSLQASSSSSSSSSNGTANYTYNGMASSSSSSANNYSSSGTTAACPASSTSLLPVARSVYGNNHASTNAVGPGPGQHYGGNIENIHGNNNHSHQGQGQGGHVLLATDTQLMDIDLDAIEQQAIARKQQQQQQQQPSSSSLQQQQQQQQRVSLEKLIRDAEKLLREKEERHR